MVDTHDIALLITNIVDPLPDDFLSAKYEIAVNTAFVEIRILNLPDGFTEDDATYIFDEISDRINRSIPVVNSNGFFRIDSNNSMHIIYSHEYYLR